MWAYARDPVTRDRIPDGKGGWVKTFTAENLVANQLLAHEGKCWQDSVLGSLLYKRELFQGKPAEATADELRRALGRVINVGRISNLEVETRSPIAGRVEGATRFIDQSTGQSVPYKLPKSATGG